MNTYSNCTIQETVDAVVDRLAADLSDELHHSVHAGKQICIALSGGNTPQRLFSLLADRYKGSIPWSRIHIFWVDERCVPVESEESNFGTAQRILFDKVALPINNIHPAYVGSDPEKELTRYVHEIRTFVPVYNRLPCFDFVLLGMGADGHTASLFPGREDLFATKTIGEVVVHPQTQQKRITLTGKVINNSREIIFLVTGTEKAFPVHTVVKNLPGEPLPAQLIRPIHGRVRWYIDKDAAQFL